MLDKQEAVELAKTLIGLRAGERTRLDKIYAYLRGLQPLPLVPSGVPDEVRRLAQMSRVNLVRLVVDVPAESMYVAGYRTADAEDNAPSWMAWQKNRLDAEQTGVHRAALAYGASYVRVLPGDPTPGIVGLSPRRASCFYGNDSVWPVFAIEDRTPVGGQPTFRLYDTTSVYEFVERAGGIELTATFDHGLGVTPFVRFRNLHDLDDEQVGEVEPLMPLQDQIDTTTFELLVAQHFQSFRQRYVMGWTADSEDARAKAGASRFWTFDDPEVKVGEFGQVDLTGYLESREATIQHLATISQTPPHHLLGKLVNLSAEALVAAESGHRRKIAERQITFGESWEQVLLLVAVAENRAPDDGAQVRWQDTEARAFAATVDGLMKLHSMGVPLEMLFEMIPNWTQQTVERAVALVKEGDALGQLTKMLEEQAQPAPVV